MFAICVRIVVEPQHLDTVRTMAICEIYPYLKVHIHTSLFLSFEWRVYLCVRGNIAACGQMQIIRNSNWIKSLRIR